MLLVLVGIQARARLGYTMTLNALQDRLAEDEGANPRQLLVSEVDDHLVGWPKKTTVPQGNLSAIHLSWRGLTSTYEMTLPYDPTEKDAAAILGLETKDAPPEEEPVAATSGESPMHGATPPAGGMPGMPSGMPGAGGPPGGAGRDPMAADADGDGKLSREEAQGRLQEDFEAADADGDGFLVLEEITAWREANPRPQSDNESAPTGDAPESGNAPSSETPAETTPPEGTAPEATTPDSGDNPAESTTPNAGNPESATEPASPAETADEAKPDSTDTPPETTPQQ